MHIPRSASSATVKNRRSIRPLLGSVAALFTAASLAQAGQTWDGGGVNSLWSNPLNWDADTLPNFANPLQFGGQLRLTPNNDATAIVAGLTFLPAAESFELTGNAITLNGGITVNSASPQTIAFAAITLGSSQAFTAASGNLAINSDLDLGANTLTVTGPQDVTFSNSATISGAGGITKSGSGRLTISGINTYSGVTRLEQGELFANGSANPFGTGQLVIAGNSRIGSLADNQTIANPLSITAPTTNLVIEARTHLDFTGAIDLNGATRTLTGTVNQSEIGLAGVISNGGVTLATTGLGAPVDGISPYVAFLYEGAAKTYTGLTTVTDGAFLVFLGATEKIVGDVLIEGNGVVDYLGGSNQIADTSTVTVNSTGSAIAGGTFAGLELFNQSDTIGTLMGTGTVGIGAGTLTVGAGSFSGVIGDSEVGNGSGDFSKNTAGTLTLSGANTYTGSTTISAGTLQLGSGGTTGSLLSPTISASAGATLAFNRSNDFTVGSVISGLGGVRQDGTGTTELSAVNTYTGPTVVNAGELRVTGRVASTVINVNGGSFIAAKSSPIPATAAVPPTATVTVATGGGFEYQATANSPLTVAALSLNSGPGTTIGGSIGATFASTRIQVTGNVNPTPGTIALNVYGSPVATGATGVYTLLRGGDGSMLNVGTVYTLGTILNATNYTVSSPSATATEITVQVTAATPLNDAYWLGGLPGNPNVWAASNGTRSNWATDPAGTMTPLVPGAGTDVFFSASGATDPGNMELGANMSIASLTINDPTAPETRAVTLNDNGGNTLTIATAGGVRINSGSGAVTLNPDMVLGASQTWTNNSANLFTVGGNVSNGANTLTVAGTGNTLLSGILGNGAGGLTKTGAGRLTVTRNNTYSGDTLLQQGELLSNIDPSAGTNSGFGTGRLIISGGTTLGSTLNSQFIRNNVTVLGNFTIAAGAPAPNDIFLTGGIDLNGGAPVISGSTPNGQLNFRGVISNGSVAFSHTGATGYTAVLYGANALTEQANTYTGLTTINNAVFLVLNKNAAAGVDAAVRGDVLVNPGGAVDYFRSNQIADTSTVTVNSNGLTIAGPTTFQGFEMRNNDDTIGALFGNGTVGLGSATLTVGRGNFTGVIKDGQFGAGGELTKNTTGVLTLTGASTFTGNTNINNGTLVLDGSVRSPTVFVNFSGTLMGTGTAFRNVVNAGVFSPGNSTGTFNIGGNFSQNAAGTLVIEIAGTQAGQHDLVKVSGTAELAGTLRLTQVNGARLKVGEKVTFLTAGGGVSGEFTNVTNSFNTSDTIVTTAVVYESNAVSLEGVQGSFSTFAAQFGLTPNQRSVATALDRIVDNPKQTKLITYLNDQLLTDLPHDFDLIAAEELQAIYTIGISQANVQTANLQRRLEDIRAGREGFSASGLSVSGLQPPPDSDLPPPPPPDGLPPVPGATGPTGLTGATAKELRPPAENRYGTFFTGIGEWVKVGTTSNASGYDMVTGGFTLGADYRINENFAVGVNLGYARTSADLFGDGRITVDGAKIGAYATYVNEAFYVDATIQGGYNSYDTRRSGLEGSPSGSTSGGEFNTLLGIGYDFKSERVEGLTFGPIGTLQYTYIGFSGFRENGSLAPLDYESQGGTSFRSTLGAKATYEWRVGGAIVKPELRVAWQHEYGDNDFGIDSRFAHGGNTFTVAGAEIGRDSLLVGAGVAVLWNERTATYLYYDGEIGRSNYDSNNVSGGVRVAF